MLDGGLSRVPQPVDRRTVRRPEPARRYPNDEGNQKTEPPVASGPAPKATKSSRPEKNRKNHSKLWISLIIAVLLAGLVWLAWTKLFDGVASTIDGNKNQAVLLDNGQTYFGKLEIVNDDYIKLSNVFYVQSNDATSQSDDQESSNSQSNMQLIKRGEEVFGPEDVMVINRDQVVYFENIKDDSQVSKLMKDYKAKN